MNENSEKKYELIIFDVDGVLVDSKRANRKFINKGLANLGYQPMSNQEYNKYEHLGLNELLKAIKIKKTDRDRISTYLNYYVDYNRFLYYIKPCPNITRALKWLYNNEYKLGIITNRGKTFWTLYEHFWKEWGQFFKSYNIITRNEVKFPKPSYEGFYILRYDLCCPKILYVGNSKIDFDLTQTVGIDFASYKKEIIGAKYIYNNHKELPMIVRDNFND